MKKKVCIVTSTRADYSLLKPLISKFDIALDFDLNLVVTGMHLSYEFGATYNIIEADGFKIDKKIEILLSSDTKVGISKSMGLAIISFSEYFNETCPDILIVLGDRFEIFAIVSAANIANIPVAHLHGGETTEGAYDEAFRHCITKMSYLHFTSTQEYSKRVIQLGENPIRVFNVGSIGVENIKTLPLLSLQELENYIDFKLNLPYGLITYHPVTLEKSSPKNQVYELLDALANFSNMKFLITKGNCDTNGREINNILEKYSKINNENFKFFTSLGEIPYLSSMKYSSLVIGNSSSGILEAPSFKIPTVNIGDRQKGRIQAESIINCETNSSSITLAIKKSLSPEFKNTLPSIVNPYGGEDTCNKIINIITKFLNSTIDLKKTFYNINF
ncbi:UDP-N-acetylglucosamine 2-epimerase (hydrolyzing) [Clostridium gasigenes]|uniref:UDP-N-acetylglucosamine 2-epimerase n=1 Tax=Clostridium gasigenes TaxID=94869 RepID=UPI0016265CC2|nr:UDP-N-acetylglucosamine 2-epimerase [Clostridium gasigenes]MBB6623565.1 UDP-N-acetylglucosamine 2-epimerase (hydrolyzing) [Clostridium gasigenes]